MREDFQEILKIAGEVRGVVFQTDREYILKKWQREGLEKIKEKAKNLEIEIPYEGVKTMEWYPIAKRVISLLLIKETFGLEDKEIREIGSLAPKFSPVVKLLFKLFKPIEKFAKEIPRYWKEHYTLGELEVIKAKEKEKEMVLHLKGIEIHPIFCLYLEGYFEGVMRFIYPQTQCQERKCTFKGDPWHEYYFKW